MARLVGEKAGDYVVFPMQQTQTVQITWWQDKKSETASYYMEKCWFGKPLRGEKDRDLYTAGLEDKNINVTCIFIAAECIDDRYAGSPLPHLRTTHIKDRMQEAVDKKIYDKVPTNWAMLKLDDKFHYGQDKNKGARWLVYHAGLGHRVMHQHRFGKNTVVNFAKLGVGLVSGSVATGVQAVGGSKAASVSADTVSKVFSTLLGLICAKEGHPLRPFSENGTTLEDTSLVKSEDPQELRGMQVDVPVMEKETKLQGRTQPWVEHEESSVTMTSIVLEDYDDDDRSSTVQPGVPPGSRRNHNNSGYQALHSKPTAPLSQEQKTPSRPRKVVAKG